MRHLIAKMRNHATVRRTAGWADWREINPDAPCPICPHDRPHRNRILHVAPLENGHQLHAWSYDDARWPEMGSRNGPDVYGWSWAVVDPSKYPAQPSKYNQHNDPKHHLVSGGNDASDEEDFIPGLDEAKDRAEKAYQKMFPVGTDTGPHDSGADYSDLNRLMREQGF